MKTKHEQAVECAKTLTPNLKGNDFSEFDLYAAFMCGWDAAMKQIDLSKIATNKDI